MTTATRELTVGNPRERTTAAILADHLLARRLEDAMRVAAFHLHYKMLKDVHDNTLRFAEAIVRSGARVRSARREWEWKIHLAAIYENGQRDYAARRRAKKDCGRPLREGLEDARG